jgi:cytochrome c
MKRVFFYLTTISVLILSACDTYKDDYATALTGGAPSKGEHAIYTYGCSTCHTIPGIRGADALVGPPLTKMSRRSYIAGVLQNTPDNMIKWLQNPPGVDPLTAMPNLGISDSDARDIASYLYTLQ